jgi:hypothetical protein
MTRKTTDKFSSEVRARAGANGFGSRRRACLALGGGLVDRRQTLSRHVVNDVQVADSSAAGELVMDKIQRPAARAVASTRISARVPPLCAADPVACWSALMRRRRRKDFDSGTGNLTRLDSRLD